MTDAPTNQETAQPGNRSEFANAAVNTDTPAHRDSDPEIECTIEALLGYNCEHN